MSNGRIQRRQKTEAPPLTHHLYPSGGNSSSKIPQHSTPDAAIDVGAVLRSAHRGTTSWLADVWEAKRQGQERLPNDARVPKLTSLLSGYAPVVRFVDELANGGLHTLFLAKTMNPTPETIRASLEAAKVVATKGYQREPARFHPAPPNPPDVAAEIVEARVLGKTSAFERISWNSTYEPDTDIPGADHAKSNQTRAIANVLRGDPDKPWLVYTHGFAMGEDRGALKWQRLQNELGYNVILPVFPFHGGRALEGERSGVGLFDAHAGATLHAIARGIEDDRAAVAWVRREIEKNGSAAPSAQKIVLLGDSLGGYRASMLSMFEENAAVIAGIAASDLSTVANRHEDAYPEYTHAFRSVLSLVSPFAFDTLTPRGNRYYYYGNADAVVDPAHSIALGRHLDAEEIPYDGGHIIGPGKRTVRERIRDVLEGVLADTTTTPH